MTSPATSAVPAADPSLFSPEAFKAKLAGFARLAGRQVVEKALILYHTLQRPETPKGAKATIVGALAYFILPFDAVTDLLPGVGFTDDLGVIMAALVTISGYVTDEIRETAARQTAAWFGDAPRSSLVGSRDPFAEHES
ncbi:MAG: YkvA family protein [Planctomycetota bacterium]